MAFANLRHTACVIGACNGVGYGITAGLETHKITDLVGAGSFVAATVSLSHRNGLIQNLLEGRITSPKLLLVNAGVILWGSRLASYLFNRVLQLGEDKRLRKFFRKPGESYLDLKGSFFPIRLSIFWVIQAAWGYLCMLPVTLLNSVPLLLKDGTPNPFLTFGGGYGKLALSLLPVVGLFGGVIMEAVADYQKTLYRSDPKNDGHWCDKGLWAYSRYPNYFGELLTWWSVYFSSLPALISSSTYAPLLGLVSPAFITLLLFKVSGIPLLEAKYKKQYKDNTDYADYVRTTPLMIPNFFKKFNKKSN
mmetsp:Transcript_2257/g.4018  ORF Transcript_2257/g.4018 Transcript_2257/m.4018 type:complete len:306 (+) Transcript_2257:80-997(+)